ncbi:hypothetical protein G7Z17_g719 [Cylindrodendrum hubeiense]|uniref:Uncharacterized protein n=1 Tax=Cylindrodendrum hubeiense TaxID=595255 RepID=A0A9P5HMU1_9HYPO|nr:hypothetical protein G7Z17_g719 [Cylindrodendrum hubeiense]
MKIILLTTGLNPKIKIGPTQPVLMAGAMHPLQVIIQIVTSVRYAKCANLLTDDMVAHEFVLQDLAIRVSISTLSCKDALSKELRLLIEVTPEIARSLSDLSTGLRSLVDDVKITDDACIRKLKEMDERSQISSAIGAVLGWTSSEQQIKDILNGTTQQLSDQLFDLYSDTVRIIKDIDDVKVVLGRIQKVSLDDLGELSDPRNILSSLWTFVDQEESIETKKYLQNRELLNDLLDFYKNALEVTKLAKQSLRTAGSEISGFRNTTQDAFHRWIDDDVQALIERFESGRQQLEEATLNVRQIQC